MCRSLLSVVSLVATCCLISGCGLPKCCFVVPVDGREGETHYVVVGLGIISTGSAEDHSDVTVSKVQAIGATISDQPGLKLNLGFASSRLIMIPDGSTDVRIEVSDHLVGPLRIDAASVRTNGDSNNDNAHNPDQTDIGAEPSKEE